MNEPTSRDIPPIVTAAEPANLSPHADEVEFGPAAPLEKTPASRSKRFFHGAVFGYCSQVLMMLTGLWLTPFLLRHLGQHDFGLWLTALQIMTYLGLVDFGIIALLPRTVAYATGRAGSIKNATDLPHTIGQTAAIVLGQTPVVALAAVIFWLFLPREWLALRGPLALIMAAFAMFFPLRIFAAVLEGLQEQAFVIRANMITWTIGTLTNVLLILAGCGLYSIAVGWILSQFGLACACGYRLWTKHREVMPSRLPKWSKQEMFGRLGRGFWVSMNQVGVVLMAGTDVLIISRLLGPGMVVPYACTGKLASTLANQPQMFMHLATPGLSEMKTATSKDRLYQVMIALGQGMLLLTGLLCCLILVVNEGFVHWWVGTIQYGGFTLTCMILLSMALRHWSLTFTYTAFCFGHERILAITGLLDGMVTAGSMFLLISRFGYVGVVAGSILGVCLTSLPITMITVARELDLSFGRLVAPFWPWFWRCALVAGGCMLVARNWTPRSPLQMIAIAGAVVGVYCAFLFRPILASPLGPYLQRGADEARHMFLRWGVRLKAAGAGPSW